MKVSFISTVYNEELTITRLLRSLFSQSKFPEEIIIVDGGSTDNTISVISKFKFPALNNKSRIKLIFKKGNRSVGRNEAIKNASNEIIVCSDAGCVLDKNWLKNIVKPFEDEKVDVVAGYYRGEARNVFQKCLIPYVLVMPDRVDKNSFLPASRSMAFKKSIWENVGRFPEEYDNNEDYVFAKRLKKIKAKIVFEAKAVVYWTPRRNILDAFVMFYNFAKGDAQSHIFRTKVAFIFLRYISGLFILSVFFIFKSIFIFNLLLGLVAIYIIWSIVKNYKYVNLFPAIYYLPLIQISSDLAIIIGTIRGYFKK